MVLVKENHIRAAGGVGAALRAVAAEAAREDLEVEIEVATPGRAGGSSAFGGPIACFWITCRSRICGRP